MMSLNPTFTRVPIRAALSATATIALFALITPSASALPSAAWSEEGTQGGAAYGFGAATAGDINGDGYSDLVVASPWFDVSGSDRGRAWLYSGSPTGLGSATWQTDGTDAGDHYGYSVACVGDVNGDGYDDVLVGAALSDTGAQADDGAIYLYFGSSSGLPTVSSWWSDGPQATALLGSFVAGGADFNGDGYDDLVAGAPGYNPGGLPSAGRIQIYLGSATTPVYSTSIVGTVTGGWVGHVMITLDFNGDGYDDLVTTQLENGQSKHMLFLGNSGGLSTTPAKTFYFGDPINGSAISSAGDVNGDGYEDLLFGEPGATSNAGRIRLWYGSSTLATTAEYWWILDGAASGEKLGSSLGCAGDMNGDGYGDFLVHAEAGSSGQARLFYGSKDGPTYRQVWALADGSDHYFAWRLSTAGDVDGDGYSDLFLASPYEDTPGGGEGRVDVYRGSADSPGAYVQWNAQGSQADCLFGTAVALGDFDGNGTDDIAVGTGSFDGAGVNSGLVSVYDGWDDVADTPEWSVTGETAGLRFGDAIASALDVDGDGYEDLLVGAPGANGGRGEARLYRGGL
ncbi:MAG: FG-GAP repeat protein, partial [Candidatus Eisenbacteria bacterium]|nr:FG-GAP repeat protein [Candidatus Eisenbacteria bacterium]